MSQHKNIKIENKKIMQLSQNSTFYFRQMSSEVVKGFSVQPGGCVDAWVGFFDVIEQEALEEESTVADLADVRMNLSLEVERRRI